MIIAIYPGTFDPITLGHINILEKACAIFDSVVLAVANVTGKNTLFSWEERTQLCKEAVKHIPNVQVIPFDGLVVDFAKEQHSKVMIRGMRAVSDFEYELQLAIMNKKLNTEIETMFLVPNFRYLYLSSSMVRQVAELKGDLTDLVPACVITALQNKFMSK